MGGTPFRCETGHEGRVCAQCSEGYYELNGACKRCDGVGAGFSLAAAVIFALLIIAVLLWFNTRLRLSFRLAVAFIGLNALQVSLAGGVRGLFFESVGLCGKAVCRG